MRARLAALLLLLLPSVALAQGVPLPYHTVQGCLGLPGTGCPSAQAIPFSNLLSQLLGLNWAGVARMVPHQGQTANANDCYTLTDPYGNAIPCTSSTTTQGLQEFLNATAANGWPAVTYCQGTEFPSLLEPVIIEATTSVTVPVAQDWSYHSYGCNLNFNVTTVPGLIVDSEGASVFDWDGKIVYNVVAPNGNTITNPSCTVLINPVTNTADGFPGLYAGYFRIKNPVSQPQGGTTTTGVVCINTSTGSTIQQRLDFTEVNPTQGAYFGVLAFGASSTTGLQQTEINIQQLHGALLHAVDIGYTQTNQANYNGNQWKINNIEAPNTSARGIETFGSYDSFDIGTINAAEGGLGIGIVSDTGSANNKFRALNITGYTSNNYVDNGTCNLWEIGPAATGSSHGSSYPFFGSNSGCTQVVPSATASGVLTLPAATDQLVGRATTDTLTNKTLTSATDSLGGVTAAFGSDAKGDIYTNSGTSNVIQRLAIGASGTVLQPSSGLPAWTANPTLGVQQTTQGSLVLANTAAGAFSTTIKSSNSATAAATYTLPTAPPGGNGYSLTSTTAGVMSWTNVTGGSGTPCTTTGSSVQYNAAGSFGCVSGVSSNGTAMTFASSDLLLAGSSSGSTALNASSTASGTLTLPAATDQLVGRATTDTLTNKSIASSEITGTTTNDNAGAGVIGEYKEATCPIQTATVTITIASPAVVTWTGHGYLNTSINIDTCPITFSTSGALPTGITAGTAYWVVPSSITTNTFQIATSVANALAGTAVNTSGSQSGTQTGTATVPITSNSGFTVTGLNLTAGDWECRTTLVDNPAGTTVVSIVTAAVSQSNNTLPNILLHGAAAYGNTVGSSTGTARVATTGPGRYSNSTTTPTYAIIDAAFTISTDAAWGSMSCRRER